MRRPFVYISFLVMTACAAACKSHEAAKPSPVSVKPVVEDSGRTIRFPADSNTLSVFKTSVISKQNLDAAMVAPAHVAATVTGGGSQPLVLFEDPALSASYTAMLQNLVNIREKGGIILQKQSIIKQKNLELSRFKDLAEHGAGTGKDVADAQTDVISAETDLAVAKNELANEKTAILEHEARLKLAGFDPQALLQVPAGKVWVICDIPEIQVTRIKAGSNCVLQFGSYPGEKFTGIIEAIADVIDNTTRMVKLRIAVRNGSGRLRAGMFATVSFDVTEGNTISIPQTAIVTVQGKDFVFVKKDNGVFERRCIVSGAQINDRLIVYSGIQEGDAVVTQGAMQLKGISFGY